MASTSADLLLSETDILDIAMKSTRDSKIKKPYQCQKCGKRFALRSTKSRHLNYECGHEPRFQCPYCPYRSKQTSPMYAHIRRMHSSEDVYMIDLKI